jgi:hypothetical protein
MKFEFKGQTYEVDENNVIFSINKNGCIAGIEFGEPVKVKPRWCVMLTTRNVGNTNSKLLFENDDYNACRSVFNIEKERLVKNLIIKTDAAFRLKITSPDIPLYGCATFSIISEYEAVEYYLILKEK